MGEWAKHWGDKLQARDRIVAAGRVVVSVHGTRIHVICPYNAEFKYRAYELGGRWRHRSKVWSFPGQSSRLVVALLKEMFGDRIEQG